LLLLTQYIHRRRAGGAGGAARHVDAVNNGRQDNPVRVFRPPAPPACTRYPPAALLFALLPVT